MHKTMINTQADKALALGILGIIVIIVIAGVRYLYIDQLAEISKDLELVKVKNARVEQILGNEASLSKQFDTQRRLINREKLFLNGRSSEAASSELQNGLKRLITTHSRSKIQTIKPIPAVKMDDYSELSLEIRVRDLDHKGLQNLLYQIEAHSPVLVIKELDLKRTQLNYRPLVKQAGKKSGLEATFVVSGYFRHQSG